jgi:hypothetical protein
MEAGVKTGLLMGFNVASGSVPATTLPRLKNGTKRFIL